MLDIYEKALCRKIADTFELAAINGFQPYSFTSFWLESDIASVFYKIEDLNLVAQSPLYILGSILDEMTEKGIKITNTTDVCEKEVMYWGGYIFSYWIFSRDIAGDNILKRFDVKKILQCYDTLHTLSPEAAIEIIVEDMELKQEQIYEKYGIT